ncbi:SnoaL-like protein [Rhodococcus sp. AG1013]|uniref:nuclear transport factor 2 family protein n=1 Tax=Rhodococcus sp. AG1013 TaxID=2183996 RepID=UPI000E0BB584|nr:nuclear transport factor 2 family protein [Rhodococcus sp. AG1013]RDI19399.1 SnoaL-like protein [Rhodococcus sp. AG1013]
MDLELLLAEREIARAVIRFARAMDDRDWPVLHEIMLPDATAELGTGTLHGPGGVEASIRSFLDDCGPTQHLLGNMLIDVDLAAGTATSRTYVTDLHLGVGDKQGLSFSTLGDYHDEWRLTDGVWRMSHRTKHMRGTQGDISVLGAGPGHWDGGRSPVDPRTAAADIEAIKQLKAGYFRLMDTKDWDGLAAVFTPDAEIDMTETGGGITHSVEDYMPFLRASIENVATVHHGHTPEITLTSPTTATGTWAMEDRLWWPDGAPVRSLHGYGHYVEEYRKTEAGWKIAAMRLSRLRTDTA